MMTVKQVSDLAGVSVRTLHYYDKIGLLKPAKITESGYRLYDNEQLQMLRQILFFRELDFSLKEIKKIINSPDFDRDEALKQQEELLRLKRKRLDGLIDLILDIRRKGLNYMSFKEFDKQEIEQYAQQARQRWQNTQAYKEYEQKAADYTQEDFKDLQKGLAECFGELARFKNLEPDSRQAQQSVQRLKNYISENFYDCTNEILLSLGEMYCTDERFKKNIDSFGEGTADFAAKAISVYCKKS